MTSTATLETLGAIDHQRTAADCQYAHLIAQLRAMSPEMDELARELDAVVGERLAEAEEGAAVALGY